MDWGYALSIRSYLDRHFQLDDAQAQAAQAALEQALSAALRRDSLRLSERHPPDAVRTLCLQVRSAEGLRALLRSQRHLLTLLSRSPVGLELDLRGQTHHRVLERLLTDLRPYSSRTHILADADIIPDPRLELWRFRYTLPTPAVRPRRLPAPTEPSALAVPA